VRFKRIRGDTGEEEVAFTVLSSMTVSDFAEQRGEWSPGDKTVAMPR
jgi:hypothetical protein